MLRRWLLLLVAPLLARAATPYGDGLIIGVDLGTTYRVAAYKAGSAEVINHQGNRAIRRRGLR